MIFIAALIMLCGMTVVVIALAHEVGLDLHMASNLMDAEQTAEIARVGLDNLIYAANSDPNWRTHYTSGTWFTNKTVGEGQFTASATDNDGNLANNPIDPVAARSIATLNGTSRTLTATLRPPVHPAMMYLGTACWTNGEIRIESGPRLYGDLAANNTVSMVGNAPDFRGGLYVRDQDSVAADLDDADTNIYEISSVPGEPSVNVNWFVGQGSQMTPPEVASNILIENKVISPASNPYGFTNADGIYYIHVGNKDVRIRNCHITATLVFVSAKAVYFEQASVHGPAFTHLPALVANAPVVYDFDRNLSESACNVDFNGDGDRSDVFTPFISGVVYSSQSLTGLQAGGGTNIVRFKGIMIARSLHLIGSGSIFEQDPFYASNLVVQFQGNGLQIVPGTITSE